MKIICLLKQVIDTAIHPIISSTEKSIEKENVKYVINPYDEFAIGEALKLKKAFGDTEVIALSLGEIKSKERIRTALAMGCDKGVLIKVDDLHLYDPITIAQLLSEYLIKESFDIIFAGKKAVDGDFSIVGGALASYLDIPYVYGIRSFNLDHNSNKVVCKRDIENGEEVFEVSLPALFTCDKGLAEVKYPSLPAIMKAKKKTIEEIQASIKKPLSQTNNLELTKSIRKGKIIEGDLEDQVKKLVQLMKEDIKVL